MQEQQENISLYDFFKEFPDEEAATAFFENRRWQNDLYCPKCGSLNVATMKTASLCPIVAVIAGSISACGLERSWQKASCRFTSGLWLSTCFTQPAREYPASNWQRN